MSQASLNSAKNRRGNPQSSGSGLRPGQNVPPQQYNPNVGGGGPARAAPFPPSSASPIANANTPTGTAPVMTLPQVIAYVDKRLCVLETFMADTKKTGGVGERTVTFAPDTTGTAASNVMPNNLQETIEEFDKRYQLLAEEIENLKNIVLSLQSYTMDVNKMLLEDRSRIYAQLEAENTEGAAEGEPQVAGEDNQ